MLRGRSVTVLVRDYGATSTTTTTGAERDSFGNDIEVYGAHTVDNVLVVPGPCKDLDASRPEGVIAALTLHFPKSWAGRLRGAKVTLAGDYAGTYSVIGDPMPYQRELCPTDWCMPVEVEAVDG